MLQFKRNMLGFGDFMYSVYGTDGFDVKILRKREGTVFSYFSQGCFDDFRLDIKRKFVAFDSVDGDNCRLAANFSSVQGRQGTILYCMKKGFSLLKNYFYWTITYDNEYYKIFEVGRKSEGTFFCIYLDDWLVAMIRKDPVILGRSTQYEIYAEKGISKEMLLIINAYLDLTRYYPDPSKSPKSTERRITLQKELKEKYDPSFIPRIKTMEGIME